jgi:hypothetical protein
MHMLRGVLCVGCSQEACVWCSFTAVGGTFGTMFFLGGGLGANAHVHCCTQTRLVHVHMSCYGVLQSRLWHGVRGGCKPMAGA